MKEKAERGVKEKAEGGVKEADEPASREHAAHVIHPAGAHVTITQLVHEVEALSGLFERQPDDAKAAFLDHLAELRDSLDPAIDAHERWKEDFSQALRAGGDHLDPETIGRDDRCKLGRWLRKSAAHPVAAPSAYQLVLRLHAAFHLEAARILRVALSGDADEAVAATAMGTPYWRGSTALVAALRRLTSAQQV